MLTKEKSRFNDITIRSRRVVKDSVRHFGGVCKVPITRTLLDYVKNAYKEYKDYMEKERKKEEKIQKEKKKAEKGTEIKQIALKRKAKLDDNLSKNEDCIQKIKSEKQCALVVIREGNDRMNKAISSKSITQIQIAQNLINQGTDELAKLDARLTALEAERDVFLKKRLKC